jgi:hypothetical protein
MTQAKTIAAIKALGLHARCLDGEYRVALKDDKGYSIEASAYYTDDEDDAVGTANAMILEQARAAEAIKVLEAAKPAPATPHQIRALAISYAAYLAAQVDNDVVVWGELLLKDQEACAVLLVSPEQVARHVRLARSRQHLARIAA